MLKIRLRQLKPCPRIRQHLERHARKHKPMPFSARRWRGTHSIHSTRI
jgi:hypothetical protein